MIMKGKHSIFLNSKSLFVDMSFSFEFQFRHMRDVLCINVTLNLDCSSHMLLLGISSTLGTRFPFLVQR